MTINRIALLLVALLGAAFLGLSLKSSWHAIPIGLDEVVEAPATRWFKGILLIGSMILFFVFVISFWRKTIAWNTLTMVILIQFILLLVFPFAVLNLDPAYSAKATWLQQQFDTLTWLGGDVYKAHSDRYDFRALSVNVQDLPFRLAAYRPPDQGLLSYGVSDWQDWSERMGYGAVFAQFIGKGWSVGCIGLVFLLVGVSGFYMRIDEKEKQWSAKALFFWGGMSGIIMVLLTNLPIQLASKSLSSARQLNVNGDFQQALQKLEMAENQLPSLQFDTGFLLQKGALQSTLQIEELATKLYRVYQTGRRGLKHQVEVQLEALLNEQTTNDIGYLEANRMLMHLAIDSLNVGQNQKAMVLFEKSLQRDPAGLMAHFHLQLLALKTASLADNTRHHEAVKAILATYQRKEKRAILAASHLMLSQGEFAEGNIAAASLARKRSRGYGK